MNIRRILLLLAVLMLTSIPMLAAQAQALSDEALVSGVEEIILNGMEKNGIPGVIMSVVRDGKIIAARDYGFADVENQIAPDPSRTAFRIASVSKLITAIAVMQLVEQGKLDMDTDVNQYLINFQIPDTYKEPITLRHILCHTTGFDETSEYGLVTYDLDQQLPLAEMMKKGLPVRIRAPGEVTQYSNYGFSLAGLIVENTSGMPFETYVQKNIFAPLGMGGSSYLFSRDVLGRLAKAYYNSNGQLKLNPYIQIGVRPSGSMISTAQDMALFMLSQLNSGGVTPILKPETLALMQTQQYSDFPGFEGYGFGYYCPAGGLEHSGSLNSFNAYLLLVPSQNAGIFLASNLGSDQFLLSSAYELKKMAAKGIRTPPIPINKDAKVTSTYEGEYIGIRAAQQSISKVLRLLPGSTSPLTVQAMEKQLRIGAVLYRPVDTDIYQSMDKSHYVYFKSGSGGRAYMTTSNGMGFIHSPWYDSPIVNTVLLVCFSLLCLVVFVVRLIDRRKKKRAGVIKTNDAGGWMTASFGVSSMFLVYLGFVCANYFDPIRSIWPFYLLLGLSHISAIGMLYCMGYMGWKLVKKKYGHLTVLGASSFLVAGLVYMIFLWNWNLLGWKIY